MVCCRIEVAPSWVLSECCCHLGEMGGACCRIWLLDSGAELPSGKRGPLRNDLCRQSLVVSSVFLRSNDGLLQD